MIALGRTWSPVKASTWSSSPKKRMPRRSACWRLLGCSRVFSAEHTLASPGTGSQTGCCIEESVRFRLLADVPPIEMRMDLLELQDETLIVTDLKTSRSRWNESKAR